MDDKEDLIKQLKALLMSFLKAGLSVTDLRKHYKENIGCDIPFAHFGYLSIEEFLESHPHAFIRDGYKWRPVITPDLENQASNIRRSNPSGGGSRSKGRSQFRGNNNPPSRNAFSNGSRFGNNGNDRNYRNEAPRNFHPANNGNSFGSFNPSYDGFKRSDNPNPFPSNNYDNRDPYQNARNWDSSRVSPSEQPRVSYPMPPSKPNFFAAPPGLTPGSGLSPPGLPRSSFSNSSVKPSSELNSFGVPMEATSGANGSRLPFDINKAVKDTVDYLQSIWPRGTGIADIQDFLSDNDQGIYEYLSDEKKEIEFHQLMTEKLKNIDNVSYDKKVFYFKKAPVYHSNKESDFMAALCDLIVDILDDGKKEADQLLCRLDLKGAKEIRPELGPNALIVACSDENPDRIKRSATFMSPVFELPPIKLGSTIQKPISTASEANLRNARKLLDEDSDDVSSMVSTRSAPSQAKRICRYIQEDLYTQLSQVEFSLPVDSKMIEVRISHFKDFANFGVRIMKYEPLYEQMQNCLQRFANERKQSKENAYFRHEAVAAYVNNAWHRGYIVEGGRKDAAVELIDIGCINVIEKDELVKLTNEFIEISPFAFTCYINLDVINEQELELQEDQIRTMSDRSTRNDHSEGEEAKFEVMNFQANSNSESGLNMVALSVVTSEGSKLYPYYLADKNIAKGINYQ